MGYTTNFEGCFNLNKPLTPAHKAYLEAFASSRHMLRDASMLVGVPDPIREAAGLPIGTDGAYFVSGGDGFFSNENESSIIDHSGQQSSQPGLWCQWVPNDNGTAIEWDGGEKFYAYTEWLTYIVDNFLKPWGYKVNGTVKWKSKESDDLGKIVVKNNAVSTKKGHIVYR